MGLRSPKMAMLKKMMSDMHFTQVLPCKMKTPDAIIPCYVERNAIRKPFMTPPRRDYIGNYRVKQASSKTYLDIEREARFLFEKSEHMQRHHDDFCK